MYEHHIQVMETTLAHAIAKRGIGTVSARLFEVFFGRFPETKRFFEGTSIESFGPRKFKIISDFLIDTLKHPVYAEGSIITEVMRHQMYGLKDREYYFALIDALVECVRYSLDEEWTPEVAECWNDAAAGLKAIIYEAAAEYL